MGKSNLRERRSQCVGRVKYVLVILGWRVMCEVKVSSWERMKSMKGRNVRERESSVWRG